MVHRVRTHVWRLGRLEVKDAYFETLTEAINFAQDADGHSVKVYNHADELTHDMSTSNPDTYA